MRAYTVDPAFGLENLHIVERPDPGPPGPGELVLRMRAASLNYRDLMMVQGHYNPRQPLPLVPCSDGVGEIVAVGDGAAGRGSSSRDSGWRRSSPRAGSPAPSAASSCAPPSAARSTARCARG